MKKFLFYLIILFHALSLTELNAQGWYRSYATDADDTHLSDMYPTQDGGFILLCNDTYQSFGVTNRIRVIKTDANGQEQWNRLIDTGLFPSDISKNIEQLADGSYIIGGVVSDPMMPSNAQFIKIDANGDTLLVKQYPLVDGSGTMTPTSFGAARQTLDGEVILFGTYDIDTTITGRGFRLMKVDQAGDTLWTKRFPTNLNSVAGDIIQMPDSSFILVGSVEDTIDPWTPYTAYIIKTDADGNQLWKNDTWIPYYSGTVIALPNQGFAITGNDIYRLDSAGNIIDFSFGFLQGNIDDIITLPSGDFIVVGKRTSVDFFISKIDNNLNEVWTKEVLKDNFLIDGSALWVAPNGEIYVGLLDGMANAYALIKLDSNGNWSSNQIIGNLFNDINLNCTLNTNETGLKNWIVSANNNQSIFYGITDSLGNYQVQADTGTFNLMVHPPNNYWQSCTTAPVTFTNFYDTTSVDVGVQPVVNCPELKVSISTPFLRRCFDNTYTVSYCNNGTVTAQNAYIEVDFDTFLIVNSSSIPWTTQTGNVFTFPIGNVSVGQCGTFTIDVTASCNAVLGQTHCVTAHAYPDTICTLPPNWSGANIEVAGTCLGDSIQFKIENTGIGNMGQSQTYLVVEDHVILRQGVFQLNAGDSTNLHIQTNGSTYRLIAHQVPNHPYSTQPTVALEGCTNLSNFSMGFITSFYEDDNAAFIDVDCQQNIGAYDPNDKRGFPQGAKAEHYILKNTDIDYHIRFQNTGTDTAFTVVIRDTIDTQVLDLSQIQFGTSSHPYAVDIIDGNTLKFTFNNIMLPDSNVNEPASHGFVKFRIPQQVDLPNGTRIENSAAIYFDFNEPIITNIAFHTIGETIVNTNEPLGNNIGLKVKAFPNPFVDRVTFLLEDEQSRDLQFMVFDALGRLIHQEQFEEAYQFDFYNTNLAQGIYFYTLQSEGKLINKGKIVVNKR